MPHLTDLGQLKTHLGLGTNPTSEDAFLTQLLEAVESAFLKLIDRDLLLSAYTDFYSARNSKVLNLREFPVARSTLTGTLTSGAATVTSLSSTTGLIAGMPVTGTGVPSATTISTVDSTTAVTLSANATASGATSLVFGGAHVWLDSQGYWGTATGSFASTTLLAEGTDYALVRDGRNSQPEAARLYKIQGVWPGRWETRTGLLTPVSRPSPGTIKVQYAAGFVETPKDVAGAIWQIVARLRASADKGYPLSSESYEDYAYSLMHGLLPWEVGTPAQVVGKYRRVTSRFEVLS